MLGLSAGQPVTPVANFRFQRFNVSKRSDIAGLDGLIRSAALTVLRGAWPLGLPIFRFQTF